MPRVIRNRLTDLLLGAFRHQAKREAILALSLYCTLRAEGRPVGVTVADVRAEWASRYPPHVPDEQAFMHAAVELEGLLQFRRRDVVSLASVASPRVWDGAELQVEAHPDAAPDVSAVCERVRRYAEVVREAEQAALDRLPTLRRAVAEAAICFNAGLFFEAHEHLEHHWVTLPADPTKRFIQGLVQISVGFHHAMRGSYEGAVNQLAKGLEKITAAPSDPLGVDVLRFRREVMEVRQRIVGRGPAGMRQTVLRELPRIHLTSPRTPA